MSSFSGGPGCCFGCVRLRPRGRTCSLSGSGFLVRSFLLPPTGSSLACVSTTIKGAGSSACCSQSRFFERRTKVSVGSSSASSSVVSWRIFRMKSSGSWSCLSSLIFIGFGPAEPFSIASCVRLVFLAGLFLAFSAVSGLRLVYPSSGCDVSSRVHPRVCFSRSCRLFVAFFGVVSGRPLFSGLIARMGGTNNVNHYATPVQDFFPSTRDSIAAFKHSVMIATQSTFSPS